MVHCIHPNFPVLGNSLSNYSVKIQTILKTQILKNSNYSDVYCTKMYAQLIPSCNLCSWVSPVIKLIIPPGNYLNKPCTHVV